MMILKRVMLELLNQKNLNDECPLPPEFANSGLCKFFASAICTNIVN
jgi:hypothetical protein